MIPLRFNEEKVLIHSTRVTNLPVSFADNYPSYYKILKGDSSEGPTMYLYSPLHYRLLQPNIIGYELSYRKENSAFQHILEPKTKTNNLLRDFESFGFLATAASTLTLEIFQDGVCHTVYDVDFSKDIPSDEFLYYFSLKHKCNFHTIRSRHYYKTSIIQKFKRVDENLSELKEEFSDVVTDFDFKKVKPETNKCDFTVKTQKNWIFLSLKHFHENMNLLGYPVDIDKDPRQWGDNHSVYFFKWLIKTPPKKLLDHIFEDTCYAIGSNSDGEYLCINNWGKEILNKDKKCLCNICDSLRKENDSLSV